MTQIFSVLAKVIPVLILLAGGYLLKRSGFVGLSTINDLKKMVVNISLPALLFMAFLHTDFQRKYLWVVLLIFTVNIVMLLAGKILAGVLRINSPYFPLLFSGFEMGMMGISLFATVFGQDKISVMGIIDLGHEFYIWFVLLALLLSLREGTGNWRKIGFSFITSPVIIAIFSGLLFNLAGWRGFILTNAVLSGIYNTVELVSNITVPLILLIIGYQLNFQFDQFSLPLKTVLLRLGILMPIYLGINNMVFRRLLDLPPIYSTALLVFFILPPPFIIPLFVDNNKQKELTYINNTLSLGSLITVAAFITVVFLYG